MGSWAAVSAAVLSLSAVLAIDVAAETCAARVGLYRASRSLFKPSMRTARSGVGASVYSGMVCHRPDARASQLILLMGRLRRRPVAANSAATNHAQVTVDMQALA